MDRLKQQTGVDGDNNIDGDEAARMFEIYFLI
jgi:hypothetical protein